MDDSGSDNSDTDNAESDNSDTDNDEDETHEFDGSDWAALLMGASECAWEDRLFEEEQAMEADEPACLARRSSEVYRELQDKIAVGHPMTLGELCASMVYLRKVCGFASQPACCYAYDLLPWFIVC